MPDSNCEACITVCLRQVNNRSNVTSILDTGCQFPVLPHKYSNASTIIEPATIKLYAADFYETAILRKARIHFSIENMSFRECFVSDRVDKFLARSLLTHENVTRLRVFSI